MFAAKAWRSEPSRREMASTRSTSARRGTTRPRPRRPITSRSSRATSSSSAASGARPGAASTSTRSARATEQKLAEVAEADAAGRGRRRAARRAAPTTSTGRRCRGAERAKYIFRIARAIQEKARELAIVESMDGGKPIKESRDVDIPLAAAHFFYHAGWADKLDYAFHGPARAPARRRRADHPVELPAAHGGVEARARARVRQHRACSSPPRRRRSRRSSSRRSSRRPSSRRASSTSSPARARRARRSRAIPDVDKIAFTGLDRGRQAHPARGRRHEEALTLELGGKAANIVFADAPHRSGRRRDHQRHLLQPGPRLLRRLAPARRGERARRRRAQARATAWRRCASAIRSTRTPTSAPSTRRCSSRRSRELVAAGEEEGAERYTRAVPAPAEGLLVRADVLHRRRAVEPHRARGDLRPGARR